MLAVRDRLVVIPTRAAASLLTTALERSTVLDGSAIVHPEFVTSRELPAAFAQRAVPNLTGARPEAREVLMGVACRSAALSHPPPFSVRPGLVAEMLAFYDALQRRRRDVSTFERLALGRLEPGADYDRGAERLTRQTRFMVAAFTAFEQLSVDRGLIDDRVLREIAMTTSARQPWQHVVVTVGDESRDRRGLSSADWDLLARVPDLERLDVVVTDRQLAGEWHEHIHQLLPGLEEVRFEEPPLPPPTLRLQPAGSDRRPGEPHGTTVWVARDREEEIVEFARWTRSLHRQQADVSLDRVALVVYQPLPYVYLAREVLRSANVPSQCFDALPLAAEPYAAVLDLIFAALNTKLSRTAGIALLSSPHLRWTDEGEPVSRAGISAADELLAERGYLGGVDALERIVTNAATGSRPSWLPALTALTAVSHALEPLRRERPASEHLETLLSLLKAHDVDVEGDDALRSRQRRARSAIQGILTVLRDEFAQLDAEPVGIERVEAIVRRWIDAHTFAPRVGEAGVQIVDAETARFGDFDYVHIAGVVDGEWPDRPKRNIFYGAAVLRDLGWSSESEHIDQARAAFIDLLSLPSRALTVSTFAVENDGLTVPSSFADEVDALLPQAEVGSRSDARVFETEVLAREPVTPAGLDQLTTVAARWRWSRPSLDDRRFHGATAGHTARAFSLSALERYQDCPFKFFAADVLRLSEIPEDEPFLSPRARGRFVHEVFQRFFEAWDARGATTITVDNIEQARVLFVETALPLLAALNESDAALERARLFGSAISIGLVDVVLGLEASRPAVVRERWLESRFEGEFHLGGADDRRVPIRGVADRIDLLDGNRLRVVDYKTGYAPDVNRALQVPVYALCAQERLHARDGTRWGIDEASYIAFTGKRHLVPVIAGGDDPVPVLESARERTLTAVDGILGGDFAPRPHDPVLCRSCGYSAVCRKDVVDAHA